MKHTLRIARIFLPTVLMLISLLLTKQYVFDIAGSTLLIFPLIYILNGVLCKRFCTEWVIGTLSLSLLFYLFSLLLFNIGGLMIFTLIYIVLSAGAYGIKRAVLRTMRRAK